jgi:D-glycero-alpha-D-manno-heptose 1-phosphate guanylyltransferase
MSAHLHEICTPLAKVDVLILCGGKGTRLSQVIHDKPKSLAPVKGIPFLDILVENLLQQGFRRIIFCVGYLKEQIIERYRSGTDAEFVFSEEEELLGTGGAINNALPMISSNTFFVVNGDSLCPLEFKDFYHFHQSKASQASFVLSRVNERYDGGVVKLDEALRIQSFMEKSDLLRQNEDFINSGIYIFEKEFWKFEELSPIFSLEYDLFPLLIKKNSCYGYVVKSNLVDIGTPERYTSINNE